MAIRPLEDGSTLRLWYWEWDGGGMYLRLTDNAIVQVFDATGECWRPIDGYYLKRATQDPDFFELVL